ncbi:MAG: hypothetical protein ABI672_18305 [Vicinamibacteria bacterium]
MTTSRVRRFLAHFTAVLMAACGSSSSGTSPSGSSSSTAAPTATPVTATPTPALTPSLPASCRNIPVAMGTAAGCHQEASDFLKAVTEAVSIAANSTAVDPDTKETFPILQNGVLQSPNAYLKLIVDALDRQGICAVNDGEELNIRNTNAYNEMFDVITSSGGSWVKYQSTCSPAIPMPAVINPPVQDPECKLVPSKDSYCDKAAGTYNGDVIGALDEMIAQDRQLASPLIFDFRSRALGDETGWKVANVPLYFSEMRKRLRTKGYCSVYPGDDELLIKKGTNRFSEHWDLLRGEEFSLRNLAAVCHDAAF